MYNHSHLVQNLKFLISRMPQVCRDFFLNRLNILKKHGEEKDLTNACGQGRKEE